MANGLNKGLRRTLGIESRVISACHSVTLGFDLAPIGRPAFDFPALTFYPQRSSDRMAYLSLFPIGQAMRANLMVYRDLDDPWLQLMREAPEAALERLMPRLAGITGDFKVVGPIRIRPADLYVAEGHRQPGVVLIGDAFCTSCPAGGTGTDKVFTDVERLCNVHIPNWLATPGMAHDKIDAFYDDPIKTGIDAWSTAKAFDLRALSTDNGLSWRARRWGRFLLRAGQGRFRQLRRRLAPTDAPADPRLDTAAPVNAGPLDR
jgi:2-polyprenyl-6-methoxyphenol hydroxylase-like FAD-dependent oxidoreductase